MCHGRATVAERIPMDPESNWDICPVCLAWLAGQDGLAGQDDFRGVMRSHHEAHKRGDRGR
jgi:hypothetical protein